MKKVYFFQPNFSYKQAGKKEQYWLPYTIGCLWAYTYQHCEGWELGDLQFKRDSIKDYVDKIESIDLACFSTYMWNKEYNIKLATAIKDKFPNVHITFGGPQITDKYLEFGDSIVLGEGEASLVQLMNDISENVPTKQIYENPRMPDLSGFPSPYITGVFDKLIEENPDYVWSVTFETDRGCPYSCTFCEWGGLTASKVFQFDFERVIEEIEWVAKNPIVVIFFANANFGIFKDRDLKIASEMAIRLKDSQLEYIGLNYLKNSNERIFEIAKLLNVYAKGVTLSAQSMNPATLEAIKRSNMKSQNLTSMFKLGKQYNTVTYTELILGLPLETKETWCQGIANLMELGQHTKIYIQKGTLLPNTVWSNEHREKYDIKTVKMFNVGDGLADNDDEEAPESMELILSTNTMSVDDMHESWMYSWMCEQMHYNGYSQLIAKYLRYKYNIPYREYYDTVFNLIQTKPVVKDEFKRISEALRELYSTGDIKTKIGIRPSNLELVSRKEFFKFQNDALSLATDAAKSLGNKYGFVDINPEVMEMQKRFISSSNIVQYETTLDVDLETGSQISTKYIIKSTQNENKSIASTQILKNKINKISEDTVVAV